MKRTIYLLFLLLILFSPSFADKPIDFMGISVPDYSERWGDRYYFKSLTYYINEIIPLNDLNELEVILEARMPHAVIGKYPVWIPEFGARDKFIVNIDKKEIENTYTLPDQQSYIGHEREPIQSSNIIFDTTSIVLNQKQVVLENSKFPRVTEGSYYTEQYGISSACLGEKNNLIGGAIYLEQGGWGEVYYGSFIPMIWNSITGENLFEGDLVYQRSMLNYSIGCYFSPTNKFLVVRGVRFSGKYPLEPFLSEIYPYSKPGKLYIDVIIIDLNSKFKEPSTWEQIWQFYKDAAFTSDDRFLVTEWQGVPTLFSTYNLNVPLRRYETPAYMTACTFSPDEQKVYIACEDQKIYVFDANLPSAAAGWEVY